MKRVLCFDDRLSPLPQTMHSPIATGYTFVYITTGPSVGHRPICSSTFSHMLIRTDTFRMHAVLHSPPHTDFAVQVIVDILSCMRWEGSH
jgi:hypothetical protein